MLGTTFGGNHLACAASIAVLDVMKSENLLNNVVEVGQILERELSAISAEMSVRGRGLMIGIEFPLPVKEIRNRLLHEFRIFTGFSGSNVIRLLPPLTLTKQEAIFFVNCLRNIIE